MYSTLRSVTVTEGRSGLALKVRKSMRRRRCVVSVVNRAREALLAVAPQGRGVDVGARAVAQFEPHGAFQPPLVAVQRIDEVFERKAVFARARRRA